MELLLVYMKPASQNLVFRSQRSVIQILIVRLELFYCYTDPLLNHITKTDQQSPGLQSLKGEVPDKF